MVNKLIKKSLGKTWFRLMVLITAPLWIIPLILFLVFGILWFAVCEMCEDLGRKL